VILGRSRFVRGRLFFSHGRLLQLRFTVWGESIDGLGDLLKQGVNGALAGHAEVRERDLELLATIRSSTENRVEDLALLLLVR
jgi:hypothetical protein